jgi:hypothetical protein
MTVAMALMIAPVHTRPAPDDLRNGLNNLIDLTLEK